MSEIPVGKIYASISNAMHQIWKVWIRKTHQTNQWNLWWYLFRSIDDIMNYMNKVLYDNNIIILINVLDIQREERTSAKGGNLLSSIIKVEYKWVNTIDGSFVIHIFAWEAMDSWDKSIWKALSYAYKMMMTEALCIPTEDKKDPDYDQYEVVKSKDNIDIIKEINNNFWSEEKEKWNGILKHFKKEKIEELSTKQLWDILAQIKRKKI